MRESQKNAINIWQVGTILLVVKNPSKNQDEHVFFRFSKIFKNHPFLEVGNIQKVTSVKLKTKQYSLHLLIE